jgi:hypothetical protein
VQEDENSMTRSEEVYRVEQVYLTTPPPSERWHVVASGGPPAWYREHTTQDAPV